MVSFRYAAETVDNMLTFSLCSLSDDAYRQIVEAAQVRHGIKESNDGRR